MESYIRLLVVGVVRHKNCLPCVHHQTHLVGKYCCLLDPTNVKFSAPRRYCFDIQVPFRSTAHRAGIAFMSYIFHAVGDVFSHSSGAAVKETRAPEMG